MRRLIAYSFDLMIASPFVFVLCYIIQLVTQSSINYAGFYLIVFPVVISLFEYTYEGKTPGKFIMRLKVVSVYGGKLPLITLLKRSTFLTYYLPVVYIFLNVICEYVLKVPHYNFTAYYSSVSLLILLVVPLIATAGSQCWHDYMFNTAVIPEASVKVHEFKKRHADILIVSLLVAVTGAIYFVYSNSERATNIVKDRGYLEDISRLELKMSDINPATYVLEKNVDDLFKYYADLHGFVGMQELNELDKSIGIQTPPIFTFTLDRPRYVPVFRVFVTVPGLLNRRFKDAVTRNLLEHTLKKTGSSICIVEFIHHDKVLGLFYILVKQIQVGVHTGNLYGSKYNHSMVLGPKNSGYVSFSNTKIPLWNIE